MRSVIVVVGLCCLLSNGSAHARAAGPADRHAKQGRTPSRLRLTFARGWQGSWCTGPPIFGSSVRALNAS